MIKETICLKEKKTCLTVTDSKISAVLRSNTTKTGVRLYDDGCLGIAGAIGAYDDAELTKNAKRMLNFKMPYDAEPTANAKRVVDYSDVLSVTDEEFVEISRKLAGVLAEKYPKYIFSNKIYLRETEDSLINDAGTELIQKDRSVDYSIVIKYRDSKNLMDGFGTYEARNLDFDEMLKSITQCCEFYENKVDFSEAGEKIPVVLFGFHIEFLMKFATDLNGDAFANGASLFSGKTGEKLFNNNFSLLINRCPEKKFRRFFDGEGVILPDNRFALIENGVLKAPYTSKRMAKRYGLPVTGAASTDYDSAPDASPYQMAAANSGKTIKELLGGRKAVFVVAASGGDFTPQGEYASPIQAAFLYDGEKFVGRLPQLSMSSNVSDMFGKDYIGVSTDGIHPGSPYNYMAVDMNVKKIDSWM